MTFITHRFRVSVVSDVRERVQDLGSPLRFMLRRSSLVECVTKREIFFQNLTLDFMTKTLNHIIYFFPPPKSEYFFQQHWESEYLFRKKTITPH